VCAATAWPLETLAQESDTVARVGPILHMQAEAIANKSDQFIEDVIRHVEPTARMASTDITRQRFELLRLLREVPDIVEIELVDSRGKVGAQASRWPTMTPETHKDLSKDPKFSEALAKKIYYGPVHFRKSSKGEGRATPLLTLSLATPEPNSGVSVCEVSLESIQSLVNSTRVGDHGIVYIVDGAGSVVAHTDVGLQQHNFSNLSQVQAARGSGAQTKVAQVARDSNGHEVLAVGVPVPRPNLGWLIFLELPVEEATSLAQ